MSNNLGWKLLGIGALAVGATLSDKPAEATQAVPATKSGLVCAVEKNTLVLKEAGPNGALRASLDEDGTVKGKTVSGRGMIYDPKNDTKALVTGVNFKADFKTGACEASVLGDVLGSATVKGQMAVGTSYPPANFTFGK